MLRMRRIGENGGELSNGKMDRNHNVSNSDLGIVCARILIQQV